VYDGDTFTLATGDKIRLAWVNTPEMKPEEPWAREARAFTDAFVNGREVKLRTSDDPRDGYGRIVAGVTTDQGDLSVGLLEEGLGHVFLIPPEEVDPAPLLAAQERARAAGRGIWSTAAFQGALHITSFHGNGSGDDATNPNGEYLRICNIAPGPVDLTGFQLRNRAGQVFKLASVVIPAGHTVRVHSGRGGTQANPAAQLVVYLGADSGVWEDEGDVVEIVGPDGGVVDFKSSGHPK
jgi:hypothetical protein